MIWSSLSVIYSLNGQQSVFVRLCSRSVGVGQYGSAVEVHGEVMIGSCPVVTILMNI